MLYACIFENTSSVSNILLFPFYFEQVASWYYYKRSSLHIVENKLNYPNEPLPKPENLKKNFNNCVMEGKYWTLLKLM